MNEALSKAELENSEFDGLESSEYEGIAGIVWKQWTINVQHRQDFLDEEMLNAHHMRAARYPSTKEAEIRSAGGDVVYAPLAAMQAVSGAAAVHQVVLPAGERSWTIMPTPVQDLDPANAKLLESQMVAEKAVTPGAERTGRREELQASLRAKQEAEAKAATAKMAALIEDQLITSGFYDALALFIEDYATYPFAIMKRVTTTRDVLKWKNGKPVAAKEIRDVDVRVSPFDIYPSPGAIEVDDAPFIERLRLRPHELASYRNLTKAGYDDAAIERVLDAHKMGGFSNWLFAWNESARNDAEGNEKLNSASSSDLIDVIRYFGRLPGSMLIERGVNDVDEYEYYDTEVWLVGNETIRVSKNPHPLQKRPYYKACWRSIPGQFWGSTPVTQVTHLERICNAAMRALVKNMGIASGPQIVVFIDQLPKGESELSSIYPLKIWQMTSRPGQTQAPVTFFQPQSNAQELIGVFQHYWELAGDVTGIYRYNYGADQGMQGAAQTMNGLSMLLENSNKVIRHAIMNMENHVLIPRIRDQFLINMMYGKDNSVKGDIEVVVRGSSSLIERASIRQRRVELLNAINSVPESQGMPEVYGKIRLALLTATAKDLDIQSEKFPSDDEIDAALQAAAQNAQNQPKDPRVEAAEIAYKGRIEDQKLEMEDRKIHREHQIKIKTMELDALGAQQDKAGTRAFDGKKMDLQRDLMKLQQEKAKFEQESAMKKQMGTGI